MEALGPLSNTVNAAQAGQKAKDNAIANASRTAGVVDGARARDAELKRQLAEQVKLDQIRANREAELRNVHRIGLQHGADLRDQQRGIPQTPEEEAAMYVSQSPEQSGNMIASNETGAGQQQAVDEVISEITNQMQNGATQGDINATLQNIPPEIRNQVISLLYGNQPRSNQEQAVSTGQNQSTADKTKDRILGQMMNQQQ